MDHYKSLKVLVGQIQQNIDRIKISISKYSPSDKIDVFILSEMALTGYTFKNRDHINPLSEKAGEGQTYEFCKQVALQLNSYVICGYAEKDEDKLYNSAMILDRGGKLVCNHRKKHLYETDKTWADEGSCFTNFKFTTHNNSEINACVAICMDINPYEFIDSSKFELADYCKQQQVDALFFLTAWNDHEPENLLDSSQEGIMNYWLFRLRPITNTKTEINYDKPVAFICAGRCGTEAKLDEGLTHFTGTSCILKINPVKLIGHLKKKEEGYILGDIKL